MKIILSIILVTSVILETTLLPFPITLLVILLLLPAFEGNTAVFAFIGGILLDLFSLRILGISSFFFLGVCWVRQRYGQKVSAGNLVFHLPYLLLSLALYSYLFYRSINIWYLIITAGLSFLAFLLLRQFFPEKNYKKRLSVE